MNLSKVNYCLPHDLIVAKCEVHGLNKIVYLYDRLLDIT